MRCNIEHQMSKMAFATKLKTYFVWFSCVINFVTIVSVILQLTLEHPGMAMKIVESVQTDQMDIKNEFDALDSVEEQVLFDPNTNIRENIMENRAHIQDEHRLPPQTIGAKEGSILDIKCQLSDGSPWSKCEWKHGQNSHSTVRNHIGSTGNSVTNTFPSNYGISISATFTECTLEITNVSKIEHVGKWTCFLSKGGTNNIHPIWNEFRRFNVRMFTPTLMKMTVMDQGLNNANNQLQEKPKLILDKIGQIRCEAVGGYPEVREIFAFVTERDGKSRFSRNQNGHPHGTKLLEISGNATIYAAENKIIFNFEYKPTIEDIKRKRVLVCSSKQTWESPRNQAGEVIFEKSAELEMYKHILHRPLALANDHAWNGTAFVIFKEESESDSGVSLMILSNTFPALDKVSLRGMPRYKSLSDDYVILPEVPYTNGQDNTKIINIKKSFNELYKLHKKYNIVLEAQNHAGKSTFPLVLKKSKDPIHDSDTINDRTVLLAILLPCVLIILSIAICIFVCQAYSNSWWCFGEYNLRKGGRGGKHSLIPDEKEILTRVDSDASTITYRNLLPNLPPRNPGQGENNNVGTIDEEGADEEENLYEQIKYGFGRKKSNLHDVVNNVPDSNNLSPEELTQNGACSINTPFGVCPVNSLPCLSDNDGYLISKSGKSKGKDREVDNETADRINDANSYDRLDFNRPGKRLEPHYQSSRTLKSMGSIQNDMDCKTTPL